jgi:hypothetical protein
MQKLELDNKKICDLYQSGISSNDIAQIFNISKIPILRILKNNNIIMRKGGSKRHYLLNEQAFDEWNEYAAYWAGFLMADGCIYYKKIGNPEIRLQLHPQDIVHLAKFKDFLSANNTIHTYSRPSRRGIGSHSYCQLVITSKYIVDKLATIGIIENKSLISQVKILENNKHFWRGIIDGDGCLTMCNNCPSINLVGSNTLIHQFATFINNNLNINPTCGPRKNNLTWWSSIYSKNAIKCISFLYNDAKIFLDRKKNKADCLLEKYGAK